MADPLYLGLWFPTFSEEEMLPRTLSVMRQFPFSPEHAGIGYMAVHAISFSEPPVFEQTFDDHADPAETINLASEFVHDDHCFEFEAVWDLWVPTEQYDTWIKQPRPVRFLPSAQLSTTAFRRNVVTSRSTLGSTSPSLAKARRSVKWARFAYARTWR